jgi:putative pyruvate formate lyase activating enzyme
LRSECLDALAAGARTITILGGEPTVHTDTILRIADAAGRPLPFVLNTNGSFPAETIDRLAHVVQTWVVDFKFGNDDCARRLARVRGYLAKVTPNLVALQALGRLHVRHLLMPGHVDCCFVPAARWLNDRLPGSRLALMTGYVPGWKAVGDPLLGRLLSREEIRQAVDFLDTTNLNWSAPDDVTGRSAPATYSVLRRKETIRARRRAD